MESTLSDADESPGLDIPETTKLFVNFHLSHVNNNVYQSELLIAMQESLDIDFSVTTCPKDESHPKCVSIRIPTRFKARRADYKVLAAQEANDILEKLIADFFQMRGRSGRQREAILEKFRRFI